MRTAVSLIALVLSTTTAAAEGIRLVPPKEYDRPYAGELVIVHARDQAHVRELCPRATFGVILGALACSEIGTGAHEGRCRIVVSPNDIKAAGLPLDLVMRHEIGHCNGWPGDHKGALPYEEWAVDPTPPKTPASSARKQTRQW